ncbi:MAG: pseudouridine synthase [Proteobacteria bacterium]|nr:pseudouridine synthase [Pseudomonadota bacterium]
MSEKLQKVLATAGLGSRRAMETWIQAGRVSVNGRVASIGDRVSTEDKVVVDGKTLRQAFQKPRHLLYNKPTGEICSRDDPEGRPTVFDRLPKLKQQRWISVGRLDFNTSGLLLLTTDGQLANRLMHPASGIDREYAARVLGEVSEEQMQALKDGVLLEDGIAKFSDIRKGRDESGANQWYYVALTEGRNREVRRLFESQGLTVSRLKRVRFGSFFIPSAVKAGRYIDIEGKDVTELYRQAGLTPPDERVTEAKPSERKIRSSRPKR